MSDESKQIIKEIENLEAQMKPLHTESVHLKAKLMRIQTSCDHRWSEPERKVHRTEGYSYAGDKPGTMGVDFRSGGYVPSRETIYWTRKCKMCGKTQRTERAKPTGETGNFG